MLSGPTGDKASTATDVSGSGSGSDAPTSTAAAPVAGGAAAAASASTNAAAGKHSNSSFSSLGEASGVCFLLGNHAKFGLAERCCYHFDLIETLTSLPLGKSMSQQHLQQQRNYRHHRMSRDRAGSISSQEGGGTNTSNSATSPGRHHAEGSGSGAESSGGGGKDDGAAVSVSSPAKPPAASEGTAKQHCLCGVVSLLECVAGGGAQQPPIPIDRTAKRALRAKHREFNTRAQFAWGTRRRGGGGASKSSGVSATKQRRGVYKFTAGAGSGVAYGGGGGGGTRRLCHQPRHLPLPLNPSTRVSFAYELTSIAILVDASPSLTSVSTDDDFGGGLFGEEKESKRVNSGGRKPPASSYCVPLDRLGPLLKDYLLGLVQPVDVPPVAVAGLGVAFGRWTPHLAVTVVAIYPPTSRGEAASAGLLVRDYHVTGEHAALELAASIDAWATRSVEGGIATRLCGDRRDLVGDGVAGRGGDGAARVVPATVSPLDSFPLPSSPSYSQMGSTSWTRIKTFLKDLLAAGDAALSTLPAEGRPMLVIATDCRNVHSGGAFDALSETARSDVSLSVLDLSLLSSVSSSSSSTVVSKHQPGASSAQPALPSDNTGNSVESFYPLSVSDDSHSLRDKCLLSGGLFLTSELLDSYRTTIVGNPSSTSPLAPSHLQGDYHFSFKKRSIKPNALQWYTLFTMSPFTPSSGSSLSPSLMRHPQGPPLLTMGGYQRRSGGGGGFAELLLPPHQFAAAAPSFNPYDGGSHPQERIVFAKYNLQPVRIKSLLMTRVLEGYHAKRYGRDTQDHDKVSVHLVLRLADCGVTVHYEVSFVSSPNHVPMVGQAHVRLELSGKDAEFIQIVKSMFEAHQYNHMAMENVLSLQGKRFVSATTRLQADKICKLLRWTRKEDYLEQYLCLPGWGDLVDHFALGSPFLQRLGSLSKLQRYRHFRSETFEVVAIGANLYEKSESLFSDLMEQNKGEEAMFAILSAWSSRAIRDHEMYFKVIIPPREGDLAYYCILRVVQSYALSRLFTINVDFHGELNAEQRLAVLLSLQESLRSRSEDIVVLEKCISRNVAIRPASSKCPWPPSWNEYYLHHKSYCLIQEEMVLPLITKRRSEIGIGNFVILMQDKSRALFVKFVKNDAVIYQVLSRADGIFVDIHMEASRSTFYPFHAKHKETIFSSIYERVKSRDEDCAKNLRSRANLLAALDHGMGESDLAGFNPTLVYQAEDVLRLIKLSTCTKKRLRFFNEGSGSANDLLCHLTTDYITSDLSQNRAAKLLIKQPILNYSGSWFIMRVDWYVLSVVCLELRDQVAEPDTEGRPGQFFRHLSFFTVGDIDLYQSDNDLRDVKYTSQMLDDTGGCEYLGVSEIAAEIESAHCKNASRACYEALRDRLVPVTMFQEDEVDFMLSSCAFTEVFELFVSVDDLSAHLSSNAQTMTGAKLGAVIGTLLSPIPGSNGRVFFYTGADIISLNEATTTAHDDFMGKQSPEGEERCKPNPPGTDSTPLFFRFRLDQEPVSFSKILALKKSAMLAAEASIFPTSEEKLSQFHLFVVEKLQIALNAFSSEQTLEKFRFLGRSLTEDDFEIVMQNVAKANHHALQMPLEFFISRSNSLVPADAPTGNGNDLENGFSVLMEELEKATFTIRASEESFLVLDDSASRDVLPYWCFIQVRKLTGNIIVRVHHPLGDAAAREQAKITQLIVSAICFRTNQLLLLDSLEKTRIASKLLIPDHSEEEKQIDDSRGATLNATYSCPIQHKTAIPLHRRCAPNQAILALETTVLQYFIVSNRRGIFVYKERLGSIFYMKLNWHKVPNADDNEENPHIVELLVHGCDKPGPSITDQLVCLLQRKLLSLTLDALSSLLKKNPWFNLLSSDLAFIKNYSNASHALKEGGSSDTLPDCTRTYVLPAQVQDPLILLLMFRQNICGSTFIQHLHHDAYSDQSDTTVEEEHGEIKGISFAQLPDFQFYFNSSPSQLDPNYQPLATLTDKGREYSRQAGSGIAIIEVNLQHGNPQRSDSDNKTCQIHIGKTLDIPNTSMRVKKSDISLREEDPMENHNQFKIIVEITNTTVDIEVIHKWVELSLSQVMAAWSIERHLESSRLGLLDNEQKRCNHYEGSHTEKTKCNSLNRVLPGLQGLEDMISITNDLPHPAVFRIQNIRMLRASVLADLVLELVSKLSLIIHGRKIFEGINIIRYTDRDEASLVNIAKDGKSNKCARVVTLGRGTVLKDKPIESPEYTAVFGLHGKSQTPNVQFFEQINVQTSTHQETSAFSRALSRIKNAKPSLFQRHLVFILRVSRSTRTLMTYNVQPRIRAKMELAFNDIEQEASKDDQRYHSDLQSRCIRHISFLPNDSFKQQPVSKETLSDSTRKPIDKKPGEDESLVKKGPARRISRPTSMLRPTLIGKSVEGAAMQAVAANRLRARSRPSLPQRTLTAGKKKSIITTQQEKPKGKVLTRDSSLLQKKERESAKNVTSIVPTSISQASLLFKTYQASLSLLNVTSKPRLDQADIQHLAHIFLSSLEGKGSTLLLTRLLSTCYGNMLGHESIQQLQCNGKMFPPKFLIGYLAKCWGMTKIASSSSSEKTPNHITYLTKELLATPSQRAVILMELSLLWDSFRGSSTLCCKSWLVNSLDKMKVCTRSEKPFVSVGNIEREAAAIEAVTQDFLGQLNLEQELFHFACLWMTRMARGTKVDDNNPPALPLLKYTITRYNAVAQANLPLPRYSLERRFLSLSTFLKGTLLEACEKETLAEHLLSNCETYNLKRCGSRDDICFAGNMKVSGFLVNYFIGWHESVVSALDVFVLCATEGHYINAYITKEGSNQAERLVDVVIYSAMTMVQEVIANASKNIRKLHLWRIFGEDYLPSPSSTLLNCIAELRAFSYQHDLLLVDSRLEKLLCDDLNELQLSWREIFTTVPRLPSFSHCIFRENESFTNYLIYCNDCIFLDFELDQHGRVQETRILTREKFRYEQFSSVKRCITVRRAVQSFTSFLLQWMWNDCEISF